jgi:hypothetical protein
MKKIFIIIGGAVFVSLSTYYGILLYFAKISINRPDTIIADKLQISFTEAISEIDMRVVDLSPTYSDLLGIDRFLSIYANSKDYVNEALAFLKKRVPSEQEKSIAILAMKNLEDDDYIEFFEKCTDLYIADLISYSNILVSTFVVEYCLNNSDIIVKNFYKPRIRACLKKIKAKNPEAKNIVNFILSGRYWLFRALGEADLGMIKGNTVCFWILYYTCIATILIHRVFYSSHYATNK